MSDRSEIIGGIWAEGAANAPSSPVEGETYAKSNMSEEDINNGYGYKSTPDSAKFNEILRRITTLLTLLESYGVLPWCPDTTYEQGGLCIGYNGFTYRSLLGSNINNNPVTTGSPWWDMITLLQASESLAGKARLATLSEVLTGTGTNTIVTPVNLDQKIDPITDELLTHINLTTAHGSTSKATPSRIVQRDANGCSSFAPGTDPSHAVVFSQFEHNFSAVAGWVKFPGGFMIQWGIYTSGLSSTRTCSWPVAFPHGSLAAVGQIRNQGAEHDSTITVNNITSTRFGLNGYNQAYSCFVIGLGW